MRTLRTDTEREEAAVLVRDRQRWLTQRDLPVPARADIPALFRNPQMRPAGMFEDGKLLACMIPQRDPDIGWGEGPCLFLGDIHTLPDQTDDITRLITLWASDYADRLDLPHVRAETLTGESPQTEPTAVFLRRLTDVGWHVHESGPGREADLVTRLELAAEHRPGLSALIGCLVDEPQPDLGVRGSA
ncbi:hypothetical protein [Streptomyces montanisoli]|uniref:Uncharacterized protein n=1 Tax=Streptomyces montanisoli TaxID=2798581 RepID=A0A940RSU5_9ACTN|nr:hypothetical protein [Streptomyces montanisoli]